MLPFAQKQLFEYALKHGRYTKNLDYMDRIDDPAVGLDIVAATTKMGGQPAQTGYVVQQMFHREGKYVHVQKEVSDHLLETKFSVGSQMNNIPWRAPVVEMYFEDPKLPTILLMKKRPIEVTAQLPYMVYDPDRKGEEICAVLQQGQFDRKTGLGGVLHSCVLTQDLFEEFLVTGVVRRMDFIGESAYSLNERDNAVLYSMLLLALKVFVFASMEHFKPAMLRRHEMMHGGLPGVGNRPGKQVERVFYAPNVKYLYENDQNSVETGRKRQFFGRDWVWRYYENERFVNVRGQWKCYPPVPGKRPQQHDTIKVRMPL